MPFADALFASTQLKTQELVHRLPYPCLIFKDLTGKGDSCCSRDFAPAKALYTLHAVTDRGSSRGRQLGSPEFDGSLRVWPGRPICYCSVDDSSVQKGWLLHHACCFWKHMS